MPRRYAPEGISHNPEDAPEYTHRVVQAISPLLRKKIICIEDDEKDHYPFLKQWSAMEIDIDNQFSINNGTLGLDMAIHNKGAHKMEYTVRFKIADAKLFLNMVVPVIGVCDERRRIMLHVVPLKVQQFQEFYKIKIQTDRYVKEHHIYPKAWSFE